MTERETPGYYPGLSTLEQQRYWDEATRLVVLQRVEHVPSIRFFNDVEARCLETILDHLLPQDDRVAERRIPLLNAVDARLYSGRIDGFRYESMPSDRDAYRIGLAAIDRHAKERLGKPFAELERLTADQFLEEIHDGKLKLDPALDTERFWSLLMQDATGAYYAHPWAWDEVGFGGPAYPRAYTRLNHGLPEPWEVEERRYDWSAPADSVSDRYYSQESQGGQGGTH